MSKKILICDDEEVIRDTIQLILSDHYDMIMTESGEQCLASVNSNPENIGLVILDIRMPKMNGIEVLSQIKSKHPGIPVVMISGYSAVQAASESAAHGADAYIAKPFEREELVEKVRKFFK